MGLSGGLGRKEKEAPWVWGAGENASRQEATKKGERWGGGKVGWQAELVSC